MEVLLSMRESLQHSVIVQVLKGDLGMGEACKRLDIHRVTLWRKMRCFQVEGVKGLAHKLRGATSNHHCDKELRETICKLFKLEYRPYGFRVAHFYQDALDRFPKAVAYSTLVRWFKEEGLTEKVHKGWKHHSRRPRREAFGELIQMDTSIHDWLGWGKNIALVAAMDDATNLITGAHLTLSDTTLANFSVIKQVIASYGLFEALYTDKSPIFKVTRTGGIGRINQPTYQAHYITQVQRALDELGIELIHAHSPQAKGRIERSFNTWQTRLIPELKKRGIRDLDKANDYIQKVYVPKHNARFAQNPKNYPSVFVPLLKVKIDNILAEKYHLTISNDHILTSQRGNFTLKILPDKYRRSYAKAKVDVYKRTDGSFSVLYQNQKLHYQPL